MRIKTSILVDRALWNEFKEEVFKRFKSHRKTVPPLSMVVEDLIRNYLRGLSDVKIPVYEVATILEHLNPRDPHTTLAKVAVLNPDLALKIIEARPSRFLPKLSMQKLLLAVGFKLRDEGKIVFAEEDTGDILEEYYIVGKDMGEPYFDTDFLESMFNTAVNVEGTLGKIDLSVLPHNFIQLVGGIAFDLDLDETEKFTFSLYDTSNYWKMYEAVSEILGDRRIRLMLYDIPVPYRDIIRKPVLDLTLSKTVVNSVLRFLKSLGEKLPSLLDYCCTENMEGD